MRTCFSLIALLLAMAMPTRAANWYISKTATGANNGTSLANAWTNVTAPPVVWSSINAGDTLWIDGGPSGGTNTYVGNLSTAGNSANHGTTGSPIQIRTMKDASHNGTVRILNGVIYFDKMNYWLDGELNTNVSYGPSSSVLTVDSMIATNSNFRVFSTNLGNAAITFAAPSGIKCLWMTVEAAGTNSAGGGTDVNALEINGNSGGIKITNAEVAYCWLGGAWGFGIEYTGFGFLGYGQMSIHHNVIGPGCHDNYTQGDGNTDMYKNHLCGWLTPSVGHPDAIQGVSQYERTWNNIIQDQPGSNYYIEANDTNGWQHCMLYNNLFLTTTQIWASGVIVTGHDNDTAIALPINDVWIFNNTWDNVTGGSVQDWNMGINRTPCTLTNFHVLNNAVWSTNASTAQYLFETNTVSKNGIKGIDYDPAQLEFNYNSVSGSTNKTAQGVRYGAHGDYFDPGYTNFALFAAAYPQYSSNNNITATFVSPYVKDFRPGADSALKSMGTNLIAAITNFAPECGQDITGAQRPLSGAWDIGAFQSDASLKLWLTFHNWGGAGTIAVDDSGYTNNAVPFSDITNSPVAGVGQDSKRAAYFLGEYPWPGPPAETGGSLQYFGVTNLAGGITDITNGTAAFWAWPQTNSSRVSAVLDSGYPDTDGSWYIGRYFTATSVMRMWTNTTIINALGWPEGTTLDVNNFQVQAGAWHHYAATWTNQSGTMHMVSYWDGQPYFTNDIGNFTAMRIRNVSSPNWLGISVWKHQAQPTLDPNHINPPNVGWWGGGLDDIRLYTRTLSSSEISALAIGGGTGGSGAVSDPAITVQPSNQTVTAPATATFSVTATGTPTLQYQWYKGGVSIAGATASIYSTPPTSFPADNGSQFYAIVTSGLPGTLQSTTATLTVNSSGGPAAPAVWTTGSGTSGTFTR